MKRCEGGRIFIDTALSQEVSFSSIDFFSLTCRASFLQIPGGQTFWFFFSAQFDQILETRVRKCLGKVYLQLCFILFSQNSLFMTSLIIFCTRPKPACGRQGLDCIVGPGYCFVVFSTNKTMGTNQKP